MEQQTLEQQTLEQQTEQQTPEQQTLEEQTLQRGMVLLHQLRHAARAARLEAQALELESALKLARAGDLRALTSCLAQLDTQSDLAIGLQANAQPSMRCEFGELDQLASVAAKPIGLHQAAAPSDRLEVPEPLATRQPDAGPEEIEDGWSSYLAGARRRLQARQTEAGPTGPCRESVDRGCQGSPGAVQDSLIHSGSIISKPPLEIVPSMIETEEVCEIETEEVCEHAESNDELPAEALLSLGEIQDNPTTDQPGGKSLRQRLFGSYGLSVVGHAVVLAILGSITYKAADEGNSLGSQVLQAAEARNETELTSEVEMLEPTEIEMSELAAPQSASTSIASELTQLSQTVSTEVDVSVSNSVGSSIASAISQATSVATSGSRGSGVANMSMSGKFFGVGTGGNYFCYVVDSSGSMRGGAWESAKAELMRSLKSLKPTQKFYIIFFADEFEAIPIPGRDEPALSGLYATAENIEHARTWIQSVQLNRGGPPNEALAWAIQREPDAIYLLTDGVTKVDVCGFLRQMNRIEDIASDPHVRIPIHAIAYHSLDGQQLMRQLAKENQGQFIYVPKPKK